jgi:hypothetical protein
LVIQAASQILVGSPVACRLRFCRFCFIFFTGKSCIPFLVLSCNPRCSVWYLLVSSVDINLLSIDINLLKASVANLISSNKVYEYDFLCIQSICVELDTGRSRFWGLKKPRYVRLFRLHLFRPVRGMGTNWFLGAMGKGSCPN